MTETKPTDNSAAAPAQRQRGALRRPALIIAALLIVVVAAGGVLYWFLVGRNYEDTDDAYVNGRVVSITPQTSGTVVAIGADENDSVSAGQMLVRLDPADAHIDLLAHEAQLAQVVRETRALYANNDVLQANVTLRRRCRSSVARSSSASRSATLACSTSLLA